MVAVVVLEIRAKQEKLHVPMGPGTLVHTRPRSHCLSNKLQHVSRGQPCPSDNLDIPTGRHAAPRRFSGRLASLRIVSFAD